jgi:hypothetical protein
MRRFVSLVPETIVAAVDLLDGATEEELADYFDCSERVISKVCRRVEELGLIFRSEGFDGPLVWMRTRARIEEVRSPLLCGE